jgi:5-methylcytosine-specific restriction endonuclease McrA
MWVLEEVGLGRPPTSCPEHKAENEALKWVRWNANNRTRRRAEKLGNGPVVDAELTWREVAERDGMNCRYCGVLTVEAHEDRRLWPTHDHVIPLARGGEHSMENAALACWSCNTSKKNKLLSEWTPRNNRVTV